MSRKLSSAAVADQESDGREVGLLPMERAESLASRAYGQIRGALMRGRLMPGQRLVHRPLAAELGVSPTPVREALLRLGSEGALELDARGIFRVPRPTPARYAEILALRVELEGRAAARACALATPAAIRELTRAHDLVAAAKAKGDVEAILAANERFHFAVIELAAMPVLRRLAESLWMQCGPTIRLRYTVPSPAPPEAHAHLALLDALARRDPGSARAAVARDLEESGAILLRLLDEPGPQD